MKRSILPGLFVVTALLAEPAFADGEKDLCASNLQTISSAKTTIIAADLQGEIENSVQQARAAQAQNTQEGTRNCISITQRAIQQIQNSQKGG